MSLRAFGVPFLGTTAHSRVDGLTSNSLAVLAIGVAASAQPLPGGAPGCSLLVQPSLLDMYATTTGSIDIELLVPAASSLVGVSLRTQVVGIELDPSSSIVQLTSSNALDLTIGDF